MPWNNDNKGEYADPIPTGMNVDLEIVRVDTKTKPTKAGDRTIRIVLRDGLGREAIQTIAVEGAAQWRLATLVHALGMHLSDIDDPEHLLVQSVADHYLKDGELRADVTLLPPNEQGKRYHEIKFLDGRQTEAPTPTPIPDEENPF